MLRTLLGACLAAGLLAGCGSHPEIPVSDQQALVMESSVLAAGISASEPVVVATEIQATASSTLYNERQQPVTVHYRFSGMTPEGWRCTPGGAAHHRGPGSLLGDVVWQRQYPGGA